MPFPAMREQACKVCRHELWQSDNPAAVACQRCSFGQFERSLRYSMHRGSSPIWLLSRLMNSMEFDLGEAPGTSWTETERTELLQTIGTIRRVLDGREHEVAREYHEKYGHSKYDLVVNCPRCMRPANVMADGRYVCDPLTNDWYQGEGWTQLHGDVAPFTWVDARGYQHKGNNEESQASSEQDNDSSPI